LGQPPGQGMFPPATTNNQNRSIIHSNSRLSLVDCCYFYQLSTTNH